jgi:xylan 1,4-beta-xylosidase
VDDQYSNSFEQWKAMGKPQDVTTEQYKKLERAGQLQLLTSPEWKEAKEGKTVLKFDLPRQGVSFIRLSW